MRTMFMVLLLATISWNVGAQESFHSDGTSAGQTVLWFYGSRVESTFDGTLELSGMLQIGHDKFAFTTTGPSYGQGVADTGTLAATLWIIFQTTGALDSGEHLTLRGGIHVLGEDADISTLSLGAGPGTFFLIADVLEDSLWISGTVSSTASGVFVPAEDPLTMQIEGIGTFTFDGELLDASGTLIEQLPWDPEGWPLDHHEALVTLLLGIEPQQAKEETD